MQYADASSSGWQRQRNTADSTWNYIYKLDAAGGLCTYAGNPSTNHIGRYVGQPLWDTSNNQPYVCTLAGTSSQATWAAVQLSSSVSVGDPTGWRNGPRITRASAATLTIPGGFEVKDTSDTATIAFSSAFTVDVTVSGAGGLSTGETEAASKWYHLFAIRKSGDGTVNGILTNSSSGPAMPSGYDQKAFTNFSIRNSSSSDFIPVHAAEGWPHSPSYIYEVNDGNEAAVGDNNVLASGSTDVAADVDLSAYVPPFARMVRLKTVMQSSASAVNYRFRRDGSTETGKIWRTSSTYPHMLEFEMACSTNQVIEYLCSSVTGDLWLWVTGYTMTEYYST